MSKKLRKKMDKTAQRLYDLRNKITDILDKNGIKYNIDRLYYDLSDISYYDLNKIGLSYNDDRELESFDKKELDEFLDDLDGYIDGWEKEIKEIGNKQLPFKPI